MSRRRLDIIVFFCHGNDAPILILENENSPWQAHGVYAALINVDLWHYPQLPNYATIDINILYDSM